ncbi:MAG: divalent-cation tolerance protein CutA [Lamprobacter sp.]|uniref:divalent-cation tolerance protein CutA n=1 Tax=Lamprobacter sp. TaxID=3100796 RepID=UPI002B262B74|nr:divalent-cation tolerance protein CutA [Lamprobacter sp.]MEA3638423.1 divalent-cation tolerance protein CutA [Lamprobacter sp.]
MGTQTPPEAVYLTFCTCPDTQTAQSLAQSLVSERLAACVNLVPGLVSVYRWQAKIETDTEVLLIIKTTERQVAALAARIETLHPYEVPEVISHPITTGNKHYLDWVRQCTANND